MNGSEKTMIKQKLNEATVADIIDNKQIDKKTAADIEKANTVLDNPDIYSGGGDIEKALDRSLTVARRNVASGRGDYPNLLFIGNAGTGKTGRIKSWAQKNHINLVTVSAATMDDTDLGGALAPNLSKGVAQKLASTQFDELGTEKDSVLFLDEWNRAPASVRGTLLTLIQDHTVPDPRVKGSQRFLPNFLFTVAAINPADINYNTDKLDDAELGRVRKMHIKGDKFVTLGYIHHIWEKQIKQAANDPQSLKELQGQLALADTIIRDPRFDFDDAAAIAQSHDAEDKGAGNGLVLNPRSFTNLLSYCDGTKQDFLDLWNDYCNSLDKPMIEEILKNYTDKQDKANDALKGGTDSDVFQTPEQKRQARIDALKARIKGQHI